MTEEDQLELRQLKIEMRALANFKEAFDSATAERFRLLLSHPSLEPKQESFEIFIKEIKARENLVSVVLDGINTRLDRLFKRTEE